MSLSRLALRLAAVETLAPYAACVAGTGFPTLAGRRVYDSRLDPIEDADDWQNFLTEVEGRPLIVVYSEDQETEPKPGSNYPPQEEIVDLAVELMIAARGEVQVEGPDGPQTIGAVTAALSDRAREALLDFLEAQVRALFDLSRGPTTGLLFKKVAWEVRSIRSIPQREAGASRVAARTVKFKVKVEYGNWPELPPDPLPTGLAILPQPLQRVALALDPDSSGGILCARLAELMIEPSAASILDQIMLGVNVNRGPAATPTAAAVAAETDSTDITGAWTGPNFDDSFQGTD